MNIEIGNKKIDFVYQGDNLIYPNYPARENLILHYDFSGMKNSDVTKDIARDLSGNGNNGVLQNFAYIDESGYLDNALIFDGIDDFITIPKPLIDLDNFTYSEGINVLSFRGDEVATVVDGVVEIGGRNLILNSNFSNGTKYWSVAGGTGTVVGNELILSNILNANWPRLYYSPYVQIVGGESYSISFEYKMSEEDSKQSMSLGISDINNQNHIIPSQPLQFSTEWVRFKLSFEALRDSTDATRIQFWINSHMSTDINTRYVRKFKLEKGNKATDWTPAPEDLETTTFKPLFDKKIKSALYWNRALTDEELLQVYSTQIKRI